jgi:hypothetical protein
METTDSLEALIRLQGDIKWCRELAEQTADDRFALMLYRLANVLSSGLGRLIGDSPGYHSKETTPAGELRPLIGTSRWRGCGSSRVFLFALDTAKRENPSCPPVNRSDTLTLRYEFFWRE